MDIEKLGKSFYNSDEQPLSEPIRNLKAKTLNEAIARKNHDVLVSYSKSTEGLISNELRLKIWPILLGLPDSEGADVSREPGTSPVVGGAGSSSFRTADFDSILNSSSSNHTNSPASSLSTSIDSISDSATFVPKKKHSSSKLSKNLKSTSFYLNDLNTIDLPPHKDEEQVKLDIQRSFTVLSHLQSQMGVISGNESSYGTSINEGDCNSTYTTILSKSDIESLKKKLSNLIIKILRKYPALNYYQGYHDIASIVLIICYDKETQIINEELAFSILEKLTIFHLRDFMIQDINLSVNHLRLIPKILQVAELDLFELLKQTNGSFLMSNGEIFDYKFYQGLSSILTMFSHDLINLKQILTIWDFMLSYDSILVNIYVYTSCLIYFKDDIFKELGLPLDDEYQDYSNVDRDIVHTVLSPGNLFKDINDIDLIKILNKAESLIEKFPLELNQNTKSPQNVNKKVNNESDETMSEIVEDNNKGVDNSKIDVINEDEAIAEKDLSNYSESEWFDFNSHSVLVTTSLLCFNLADRKEKDKQYSCLFNNSTLSEWIQIQDEEIAKQSNYEFEQQQKLFEKQNQQVNDTSASASDFNSSGSISLSSSLSSLTSATSSSAMNALSTSSLLLKKILRVGNTIDDESETDSKSTKKRKSKGLTDRSPFHISNIYKISVTIGFIGFMIHFLLVRSNTRLSEYSIVKYVSPAFHNVRDELSTISSGLMKEVSAGISNVYNLVSESDAISNGAHMGQVGLGNIRGLIFGFNK
ncbi:hypothetical protein CLIB1423_06S01860 [[Candida] railenensis]|uniref:Rab-GAP TBC domain-containing protein n=1 Tax=[Candida] railenensis TaxID=45579 RepID=A0A9P0VY59_9ASCO|nr:hypothetical protein CLIB1423_06S01860 [[Candida] railenensis]